MIFRTAGTQFLSTVSEPRVLYVHWRCQWQPWNCAYWMIFVSWVLVFVKGFWASNRQCTLKISSSVVELVFEDDFQNSRDSVFVNCLWASSRLSALKMSVAAVELCLLDDFCVPGPSFRQRFLSKQQSMYIEDFIISRRTGLIGWFLCAWLLVFGNGFWASNSLCTLKISSSCVELVFEDDFQNSRDSVFVNCFWATSSLCALKMSVAAVELCLLDDFCVPGY